MIDGVAALPSPPRAAGDLIACRDVGRFREIRWMITGQR